MKTTSTKVRFTIIINPDFLVNTATPSRFVADASKQWDHSWMTSKAAEAKTFATKGRAAKWISDRGITYPFTVQEA